MANSKELYTTDLFSDANLKAYYRLEGNANDAKGSNNGTGTSITYSTANGKFGQGAGFNGTTSKIVLPDNADFKPTGVFSVGAWVKSSTKTATKYISANYNEFSPGGDGWQIRMNGTTGYSAFYIFDGGVGNTNIVGTTDLSDDVPHHVVAVRDTTKIRLYVDGAQDNTEVTITTAQGYKATMYPRIGSYARDGIDRNFFDGEIDDYFMIHKALTTAEVLSLYNAPVGGGASLLMQMI